jgi:hypothetical protein
MLLPVVHLLLSWWTPVPGSFEWNGDTLAMIVSPVARQEVVTPAYRPR